MISGGTGSGKTTLLNVLSNFIPDNQRIITIEDAAELQINKQHVISLEARSAQRRGHRRRVDPRTGQEHAAHAAGPDRRRRVPRRRGAGHAAGDEYRARRLPDHDSRQFAPGRAGPAGDPGADGRRGTPVARNPGADCVRRFTSWSRPSRLPDGSRKITDVTEVSGLGENDVFMTQEIFLFKQQGVDAAGRVVGRLPADRHGAEDRGAVARPGNQDRDGGVRCFIRIVSYAAVFGSLVLVTAIALQAVRQLPPPISRADRREGGVALPGRLAANGCGCCPCWPRPAERCCSGC